MAVCLLLVASLACAEEITVKGEKGAIKGVRIDHDFGQYFYAFRGIRYAKAPVGKLRFKVRMYYCFSLNHQSIKIGSIKYIISSSEYSFHVKSLI